VFALPGFNVSIGAIRHLTSDQSDLCNLNELFQGLIIRRFIGRKACIVSGSIGCGASDHVGLTGTLASADFQYDLRFSWRGKPKLLGCFITPRHSPRRSVGSTGSGPRRSPAHSPDSKRYLNHDHKGSRPDLQPITMKGPKVHCQISPNAKLRLDCG